MTRNIVHKVGFAEADEYCQVKFGGHLLSIRSYAQGETFRGMATLVTFSILTILLIFLHMLDQK